jgi:plasmid stabilization system protein ParE
MSFTVLMLDDAEQDLLDIHAYIQNRFSEFLANEIYQEIRDGILMLEDNPHLGTTIPQLAALGMINFRHMVVMQKNRVVYEMDVPNQLIYVFLVCTERQDYDSVLRKRIMRH